MVEKGWINSKLGWIINDKEGNNAKIGGIKADHQGIYPISPLTIQLDGIR